MMSISQSIVTCFKKYLTISGRATRAEYWWFLLFFYLVGAFFGVLAVMLYARCASTHLRALTKASIHGVTSSVRTRSVG